jgi:hypothetical protein
MKPQCKIWQFKNNVNYNYINYKQCFSVALMAFELNNKTPFHEIQMMKLNHKLCAGMAILARWMGVVQRDIALTVLLQVGRQMCPH